MWNTPRRTWEPLEGKKRIITFNELSLYTLKQEGRLIEELRKKFKERWYLTYGEIHVAKEEWESDEAVVKRIIWDVDKSLEKILRE